MRKIGKLARIDYQDGESANWAEELEKILNAFNKIQQVSTEGILPLISPVENSTDWRQDVIEIETPIEELIELAPEKVGRLYKVPRILS